MARLARKHRKVFAGAATNNGQFGSAQAGTKILSNDPDVIQALPAYNEGWTEATIGARMFPPLEEMQSQGFMDSRDIAYFYQEGIPEYSVATTYYTNSVVKKPGTYEIYGSLINDNTGNALPDGMSNTNWQFLQDLSQSTVPPASETTAGIAEIATADEVKAGTDDERFVTPLKIKPYRYEVGDIKITARRTLAAGWVFAAGRSIGNAASGATERANADCFDLFEALWTDYPYAGVTATVANGELQVQTSAGANVARGVSAAADFAANRRIMTHDARGRGLIGWDSMGGTAAGRLSGQPGGINGTLLGANGGGESHTLTIAEMPEHDHDIDLFQNLSGVDNGNQPRPANTTGVTLQTRETGGGEPHNNVQPGITFNVWIKL
jgi:hypothetical protein